LPRRLQDQSGFTLVELLVAMPIALVVLSMAMLAIGVVVRNEQRAREHSETLREQQASLERMTRELREATSFEFITSQKVVFDAYVRPGGGAGTLRRIEYDCTPTAPHPHCVRKEGPVGGPVANPKTVIDWLVNNDVFEPEPDFVNPRFVGVVARVRIAGDDKRHLITLRDGVELRNLGSRF
jgi:prepilin-type N-terminal cleavage/methylation domain-containing protein